MLPITRMISKYNFYSGNNVQYIILHYTGNTSDTALANANYFAGGDRSASAHYFVDETSIYQSVEEFNGAWHCGGGTSYGPTNTNSIGIEMCCSGNYTVSDKTEANAIELVKHLMAKYNVPVSKVLRHHDCNSIKKNCPNWSETRWNNFKKKLEGGSTSSSSSTSNSISSTAITPNSTVKVTADVLNVRKGAGTNYEVTTTVKQGEVYTIVETSNGWGKLKSGAGWICLDYVSVVTLGATTSSSNSSSYKVKVNTDVLNVRKGPGTNYAVTTTVKQNEIYTIVETSNGWGKLKSGAGWICLDYTVKC